MEEVIKLVEVINPAKLEVVVREPRCVSACFFIYAGADDVTYFSHIRRR